jgi:hypothetical protein
MTKRGFKHRRTEDQFTIRGEYARNLQYVYSKQYSTKAGRVVDLIYVAADVLTERLIIGLYRENPDIENGVYLNTSCSIGLLKLSAERVHRELDKLIPPVRDKFKKEKTNES